MAHPTHRNPSKIGNPLVYPHRWTSTPPPIRLRLPRQPPPTAPAGRRTSSGFSSLPCLPRAMSRTPPALRACRAPVRIGCGSASRARRSTGHGRALWRSMRKAWPIPLPRHPPPGRRVADAWVARPCDPTGASLSHREGFTGTLRPHSPGNRMLQRCELPRRRVAVTLIGTRTGRGPATATAAHLSHSGAACH